LCVTLRLTTKEPCDLGVAEGCEWLQVRNAATLCYVALIVRIIGFKNSVLHNSARGSITLHDLVARHPELYTFLMDQLSTATAALTRNVGLPAPPTLHPLLVLLTRLKPVAAATNDTHVTASPLFQPFLALVTTCCAARPFAIRQLACRALCTLVLPSDLQAELQTRVAALPPAQGGELGVALGGANALHGALCALQHLYSVNVHIASVAVASNAVELTVPHLLERCWLADAAATGCPAVSMAYVQTLSAAAACTALVGATGAAQLLNSGALRTWLFNLVAGITARHSFAPMWSLWLKELTRFLLSDAVALSVSGASAKEQDPSLSLGGLTSMEQHMAQITCLLRCPVCEVRAEALRCLIRRGRWHPSRHRENSVGHLRGLQNVLDAMVKEDSQSKVTRRALQLSAHLAPIISPRSTTSMQRHMEEAQPTLRALERLARAQEALQMAQDPAVQQQAFLFLGSHVGSLLAALAKHGEGLAASIRCVIPLQRPGAHIVPHLEGLTGLLGFPRHGICALVHRIAAKLQQCRLIMAQKRFDDRFTI
jgi:hypothetical protein